jgi:peroxiredoxin
VTLLQEPGGRLEPKNQGLPALGYGLAAVTNDPIPALRRFADDEHISFTLLSDAKSKIIGAFDLLDPQYPPSSRWHGLALPMIVVVDGAGVVQRHFSSRDYRNRPSVDAVLKQLRKGQS